MARDRDVAAFGERAQGYDEGWRGRMHHQIADRTADLALTCVPAPEQILDVGCGTGYLLRTLGRRYPDAQRLCGVDAAPQMIATASAFEGDDRLGFTVGVAEKLGFPDGTGPPQINHAHHPEELLHGDPDPPDENEG